MNIDEYIKEMKYIQTGILDFLEKEADEEEDFLHLRDIFVKYKISDNQHKIKSLLHLISRISKNLHRTAYFFNKMEQIFQFFKKDIKKYFSNSEIFNIFKSNKRILLLLFDNKIIIMDEYIIKQIITSKYLDMGYLHYFQPEIQPLINEKWFQKYSDIYFILTKNQLSEELNKKLPEDFFMERRNGENTDYICDLIRNDSIGEFILYTNENNYSLNSSINNKSIYETNAFFLKNEMITLIEYAAFFGSINIFNYLISNGAKFSPSLWIYAIHGKNADIINHFEENNVQIKEEIYQECLIEAIKCHHNSLVEYICNNNNENRCLNDFMKTILKYYNFAFMKNIYSNQYSFYYLCKYDYYLLVETFLKEYNIDINKQTI